MRIKMIKNKNKLKVNIYFYILINIKNETSLFY